MDILSKKFTLLLAIGCSLTLIGPADQAHAFDPNIKEADVNLNGIQTMLRKGRANTTISKARSKEQIAKDKEDRRILGGQAKAQLYASDNYTLAMHSYNHRLATQAIQEGRENIESALTTLADLSKAAAGYEIARFTPDQIINLARDEQKLQQLVKQIDASKKEDSARFRAALNKLQKTALDMVKYEKSPKKMAINNFKQSLLECAVPNGNCDISKARNARVNFMVGRHLHRLQAITAGRASALETYVDDSKPQTEQEKQQRLRNLQANTAAPWIQQNKDSTWYTAKKTKMNFDNPNKEDGRSIARKNSEKKEATFDMAQIMKDDQSDRKVMLFDTDSEDFGRAPISGDNRTAELLGEQFTKDYGAFMMKHTSAPLDKESQQQFFIATEKRKNARGGSDTVAKAVRGSKGKTIEYEIDRRVADRVANLEARLKQFGNAERIAVSENDARAIAQSVEVGAYQDKDNKKWYRSFSRKTGRTDEERAANKRNFIRFGNTAEGVSGMKARGNAEDTVAAENREYRMNHESTRQFAESVNQRIREQEAKYFAGRGKDVKQTYFRISVDSDRFAKEVDMILPSEQEIQELRLKRQRDQR